MAFPPPAYETTTSPDANSVNTGQRTQLWPTRMALLPSSSTSNPSCWMQKEALEILRTSHDPDAIRLICKFVPGLDPAVAATLLSTRRQSWLDALSKVLYQRQADSPLSTANSIVGIIRRRFSPAPKWSGAWVFSALKSSTDISTIAEKFDAQIHSVFSRITAKDWVAWFYGFPNDHIQSLLDPVFIFRNSLDQYVQKYPKMLNRLQLL